MRHISCLIFCLIFSFSVVAGTSGKIMGIITDSENGEPLPGANVYIENFMTGAATDVDGYFYILNIPPGTYTLKIEYIGYAPKEITNVKVQIDLTTRVDVSLSAEVLSTETVIVVAERPIVIRDISNSQLNIDSKTIETMPITNVNEIITLQAGIESDATGIRIRNGSADQTVFMVDGLSQNDERSSNPYSAISLSSIEEIQVQTGGFNAEYGQARSGVVNIITKEGGRQKYSGVVNFHYSPAAPKHFGKSIYDKYSYFNRPYFDPAVCWTGTGDGTWDSHTQKQYYNFPGWNNVSETLLSDSDPDNDLTPEGAQRVFEWYHRRKGDITKPDYVVDIGFGGPIPFLGEEYGNPRFYLSHYRLRDMFVFPLSRDAWDENHTQLKLTANISPSMKIMATGLYGQEFSVSPYDWTVTPTGRLLRTQDEVADLTLSGNRGISIPFMPGYYSPGAIYHNIFGLKFTHTLSNKSLYEIRFQYKHTRHNVQQTESRDIDNKYEILPGYFVDEAPYGFSPDGTSGPGNVHLGGWMNLGRDSTVNSSTTLAFDLTTQLDSRNQVKTGLEFVYNDFDVKSSTYSPVMASWSRKMIYRIFPIRIGAYLQDKLEYEGFIANMGLRVDYSNSNTKSYTLEEYDTFYSSQLGNQIETLAPYQNSESSITLSPRLGISHPISIDSKIYFNYGHFRSEPFSSYRFRIQRSQGRVSYIGDPNLGHEKTVAYELGYERNLFDVFLFKMAAYYKDVTNQPGWILYKGRNDVEYRKASNNNYEDIRGLEFTISKKVGRWLNGFVNYTYDVRTSGYFGLLEYYEDPQSQREYLRKAPEITRRQPRPYARANIDFHIPENYGPEWLGFYPLASWNVNVLADWKTGAYDTYNPYNNPSVVDNIQWRDWYFVDLRLTKSLGFSLFSIQLFVDISNLFNFKYMSTAGFADQFDRIDYLESLNFSWETGVEKGNDRVGDYRPVGVTYDPLEPNPNNDLEIKKRNNKRKENKSYIDMPNITSLTFLNPRKFTFGIRISF
jgi:outer membrane receptor protein involved in Fe transport